MIVMETSASQRQDKSTKNVQTTTAPSTEKHVADQDDYPDEQFEADMVTANDALEALAEKARKAIKDGSGIPFP